jgi:hypothetical protein
MCGKPSVEHTMEHQKIWEAIDKLQELITSVVESQDNQDKRFDRLEKPLNYLADTAKGLRIGAPLVVAIIFIFEKINII